MKYQQVLAFGDSTTCGCDLLPGCVDWEQTKPLSFANKLADQLGVPCVNFGWTGGSNDRSLRLLPEALLKYPNSLVLFTYTAFARTEFFTLDATLPQVQSEGYSALGINWRNSGTNHRHQQLNELYLKEFYESPDDHNRYKAYNMLLTVQTLCEQYAQDYLQIFLYNNLLQAPDFQTEVYNAIDKDHIYQFDYAQENIKWTANNVGFGSLEHWAKQRKYPFCMGGYGHIGQEAHDNFALELYNKLI